MKRNKILIVLYILLIAEIVNAQKQVSEREARNAAISTLYNKSEILQQSSDTEIDTIFSFSNNRSNVLLAVKRERTVVKGIKF